MSGMRLSKIGYDDGTTRHYCFEPLGYGCSQHCMAPRKCWAARQAVRQRRHCGRCANFKVYFHPLRLQQAAKTRKPGVVLVGFHADWCDPTRPIADSETISQAMRDADRHTYVALTKQARNLRNLWERDILDCSAGHYHGLTLRTQAEAVEKVWLLAALPCNQWLSLEPLWGPIDFASAGVPWQNPHGSITGIIVGHENKYGAPGTDALDHIRSIVQQCKAAGVPVYAKQLHTAGGSRFLRASHPDEYGLYPEDLKLRNLPWTMPEANE